jgi:hypothetical protein
MKLFEAADSKNEQQNEPQLPALKNYKLARRAFPREKSINEGVEYMYHILLKRFKQLYSTLPNSSDRTVVEINGKIDPNDPEGLYTFITTHFYYHVRCNYVEKYEVLYQFHNCPFEGEIRGWFKKVHSPMWAFEIQRHQDFPKFYQGVLAYQPKERIYILEYVPEKLP